MQDTLSLRLSLFMVVMLTVLAAAACAPDGRAGAQASQENVVDLDVLFIGAHPDDEAFGLSTYGQWNEYEGVETGVITITRGEGGGNAVGPEEGSELGLLREREERRAVAKAGIDNIYNLDEVDFYYTVSAPLTEEIWGHEETLEKVVRVVRYTRPEVIITMDPSPTPGNHGNHQYAGRLAIEAFNAAANPDAFSGQLVREDLQPWRAAKIFTNASPGEPQMGSDCASTFEPEEPTDNVFGVWDGRFSERYDERWAQVELEAQRLYESQGWAAFPDLADDPDELPCDYFTLVESRVPFTADNTEPTAMLEGALRPAAGGLPLGTEFYLTTEKFNVVGGRPFTVTAHARSGEGELPDVTVELDPPEGWDIEGSGDFDALRQDRESTATFTVTPPQDASTDERVRIGATLSSGDMTGETNRAVQVVPAVRGTLDPLPQVEQFREWTGKAGVPQLSDLVKPVLPIGRGESRTVRVDLTNPSDTEHSGSVTLELPDGFSADNETKRYDALSPGSTGSVEFRVANENESLKIGMQGGEEGDYNFEIKTSSDASDGSQEAALNLVPLARIEQADFVPEVDGTGGEYGESSLDLSRLWEGEEPESAQDASGSARAVWAEDALYFLVEVTDDELGTVLTPGDAKRHWRTDSVEIAVDPRGDSENTSTTFKVGIFPTTDDPENGNPAAAYRDADAHQGPISETTPGMEVESELSDPYEGYTIEAKIPLDELPAMVDPEQMSLNIFIYDSDTKDKIGQTRIGWSTWAGVQGDPYRWGLAPVLGYEPTEPEEPFVPKDVAHSEASPQSILQSARDGVPLAGTPSLPEGSVEIVSGPELPGNEVTLELRSQAAGEANVFAWTSETTAAKRTVDLASDETVSVRIQVDGSDREALVENGSVLVGFQAASGGTDSEAARIR